jgi:formylglycine-generating enzyme required for sulfatase activity
LTASSLNQSSPDPDGPWIAPDWYTAAHYCNWLSEQEGLARDQWCYVPAAEGGYADGMTIPADILRRTGYRLPTEAEWEYACRSGTITSRYYGASTELLGLYARYQANSREHAWSSGGLLPNDLGLFDMLGNEMEWVNESVVVARHGRHAVYSDYINICEHINSKYLRRLRGGSHVHEPRFARSAMGYWVGPWSRGTSIGFRVARTYN